MAYDSLQEIVEQCRRENKEFWQIIMEDDMSERNVSRENSREKMGQTWKAMLDSASGYDKDLRSKSGLVGGDGYLMETYVKAKGEASLCGAYIGEVIAGALKMGESNACMKRIVAAPTAGACGVLPAVLVPYDENKLQAERNAPSTNDKSFQGDMEDENDDRLINALYVAAGIGQVIAARAYISGAAGGCQAEIGSASSMAAGALVYLQGGDCDQICHAAAMAMKNLLGLVCDPVAGLVEVPCVKRNVIGAVNALSSADMALAGIVSRIPPDQVFDAMKEVGDRMDNSLRETAGGGLAQTPAGLLAARHMRPAGK